MILRAVYLASKRLGMWHGKRITSAAFKDKRGLSVDRLYDRQVDEGVRYMRTKLHGHIVSVTVNDCNSVSAHLVYCPSPNNIFHSEINGSPDTILSNEDHCLALSRRAVVVSYEETSVISK